MKIKYSLIILLLAFVNCSIAQHDDHSNEHHEHHNNEIGIGNTAIIFVEENETAFGLHLHYIYNIDETKFGVGLGYERIFDEHKHNSIGIIGSYRPIDKFTISLSPGIAFEDHEFSNSKFAIHIETMYEFEFKDFHVGPIVGFAYDMVDYHLGFGLHLGYGF